MSNKLFNLQAHVDRLYAEDRHSAAFKCQTADELQAWQTHQRSALRQLLGIGGRTVPETVLAETTKVIDKETYTEEHVTLQVGEGVAAALFVLIPKMPAPHRAVLAFHGHDASAQHLIGNFEDAATAKEQIARQTNYAQQLALAGYLVCVVEQRGFGARVSNQYDPKKENACRHLSFEYMLEGRTLIGERCWDGMMALSYLQGRRDCLPESIGCTGHSGGGTTALWLAALDERVAVSALSGCFAAFKASILHTEHCECNYVPGVLAHGEMGEIVSLIAPRPLCIISGEEDTTFPLDSAKEQLSTVQKAYALAGAANQCSLAIHPSDHSYDHDLGRSCFDQWLQ